MSAVIQEVNTRESALSSLRTRWVKLVFLQSLLIWVGYQLMVSWWEPQFALRWAVMAALFTVFFGGYLWSNLELNSHLGERVLQPKFGSGNQLTILRGFFLAYLFGFLFSPWPQGWLAWIPGSLYTITALADLFDGYLARKFNQETLLGEKLDLSLDGLGVLIASILLVQYGQVPAWYLLVGLARYLFLAGIWLRRSGGKPVYELNANSTRRPFAGAQMGFVAVILFPLFSPPGTFLAAALFAFPFLIGFTIDWLVVNGISRSRLLLGDSRLEHFVSRIKFILLRGEKIEVIFTKWMPLAIRISLVILLAVWIQQNLSGLVNQQLFAAVNMTATSAPPTLLLGVLLLFIVVSMVLIALGAAGRLAALFVLFGVGIYLKFFGLNITEALLVTGAAALFYLGSGPYSLWMPERDIIARRLGEM
jgi:CDP-diacylglycerol--glycerol-3-phosphate 3-phosphatidyltransferase